jgi:hypothetical protein
VTGSLVAAMGACGNCIRLVNNNDNSLSLKIFGILRRW